MAAHYILVQKISKQVCILTVVKQWFFSGKFQVPYHQRFKYRKYVTIIKALINKTLIIKLQGEYE